MSRSYKKHPYCTDNGKHTKYAKRLANKVYRKTEDVPNGNFYKKIFVLGILKIIVLEKLGNKPRIIGISIRMINIL